MAVTKKSVVSNSPSKKPAKKSNAKTAVITAAKLKTAITYGNNL